MAGAGARAGGRLQPRRAGAEGAGRPGCSGLSRGRGALSPPPGGRGGRLGEQLAALRRASRRSGPLGAPRSSLPRESPNLSTWPPPPSRGSLPGSGLGERGAPGPARPPAPPPRLPGRVRRAPGAGALRTPVRLPEEWPAAWPWRFGALATMSLLPREGGEPLWKASRA